MIFGPELAEAVDDHDVSARVFPQGIVIVKGKSAESADVTFFYAGFTPGCIFCQHALREILFAEQFNSLNYHPVSSVSLSVNG